MNPFSVTYSIVIFMLVCAGNSADARGVSPYLPLNISPDIERKIERVLILAGKPIMHRPIAAAIVLDALPAACRKDKSLCEEVRDYLDLYMHTAKITEARVEGALTSGQSNKPIPNAHGMSVGSHWDVAADAYYQPSNYLLINGGLMGYQGRITPTGSVISMGFDFAQLDVGYRDHWFSPNSDSSMLMSTEAPTMPSITLSNYQPLTPLGISYELFFARMSTQHGIEYFDTTTDGHPNLAGLQLSVEPVDGYALAVNRLMEYGGGARGGANLKQFYKALFNNSAANRADSATNTEFG
ncbi:MAG: capsule assembly Wzi family protein, partial [Steroidobacter sp.]